MAPTIWILKRATFRHDESKRNQNIDWLNNFGGMTLEVMYLFISYKHNELQMLAFEQENHPCQCQAVSAEGSQLGIWVVSDPGGSG